MHKTHLLFATASGIAIGFASPGLAEGFYLGGGLEFGKALTTETPDFGFSGDSDVSALALIAGYRYSLPNQLFFGAEIETSLSVDDAGDTQAEFDRISRARAIFGYQFDKFSLFAAAGAAKYDGSLNGLDISGGAKGSTYGIGTDYAINDRIDLRVEALNDQLNFESGSYDYDTDRTAVRVGAIVKF